MSDDDDGGDGSQVPVYYTPAQARKDKQKRRAQRDAGADLIDDVNMDAYSPVKATRQRDAMRKIRKYKAWNDVRVRESQLTVLVFSALSWVFMISLFVFTLCIYAYPILPVVGRIDGFPSFGLIFIVPWFLRLPLGWGVEGVVSLTAITMFKWLNLAYLLLNLFNFAIVTAWLVMYYTYLLPAAARAHASTAGTFTIFIILAIVFVFDIFIWTNTKRIETTVPRLLKMRGRKAGLSDKEIEKEVSTL